jgi:DNA-binding IclR family transcriptional regulator
MAINNSRPAVRSAARVLDVIEFIVKTPKSPSFTTIQRETAIPKSSLSCLLQELLGKQYIEFDSETKVYLPGLQLIRIGALCINNTNFSKEIWRGLKQLSEESGETVHAVILEDRFVIFIAKHTGIKEVSAVSNIGFKLAAHATAGGKVMLSSLDNVELANLYVGVTLEKYTEFTNVSYQKLCREMIKVRRRGYAIDYQGNVPGGLCVAAPVYNKTNTMIAAVSISVLASKLTRAYLRELIKQVTATARNISIRLGNFQNHSG